MIARYPYGQQDKPQGYYDEIEPTSAKKDDLLHFLDGYEVRLFSRSDDGYEYLEENDLVLVVQNPFGGETIDLNYS